MESQNTRSPGQWAPWVDDPDAPDDGVLTPEESKTAARKIRERAEKQKDDTPQEKPE
jgi:hypothetical protein